MLALLLQESKLPSVFTGTMIAGSQFNPITNATTIGLNSSSSIGNLSPAIFEGTSVTFLAHISGIHRLALSPSRPSPDLTKVKINGIEYNLTVLNATTYTFSPGSSLFVNGQSYTIEFIR